MDSIIDELISIPRVGEALKQALYKENIIIEDGKIYYPIIENKNRIEFDNPVSGSLVK